MTNMYDDNLFPATVFSTMKNWKFETQKIWNTNHYIVQSSSNSYHAVTKCSGIIQVIIAIIIEQWIRNSFFLQTINIR